MLKSITEESMEFQSCRFNPKLGNIIKTDGEEVFMEPRLRELFYILLKNKNRVVTKEDLMSFVWQDTVVSSESISKAISDLRKFFHKNGIHGLKLKSISKLGYRLEEDVPKSQNRKISIKLIRVVLYTAGILLSLIVLIRALRYD